MLREFNILDVIIGGLNLEASDPRDKVFALLSFSMHIPNLLDDVDELIRPKYEKQRKTSLCRLHTAVDQKG